ncbi:hypothetical protein CMI37_37135 [Candidatus Pacearchaeota archaeon]|nr:hypothetical protein [Candidatus Pacearchaeota archaeon]
MAKLNRGGTRSSVNPTIVTSLSFDAPSFKRKLNDKELVIFAKRQLAVNKANGFDKNIPSKLLDNPRQAKVFLKNIGLVESKPVFIKEPFGLPKELQPKGKFRREPSETVIVLKSLKEARRTGDKKRIKELEADLRDL